MINLIDLYRIISVIRDNPYAVLKNLNYTKIQRLLSDELFMRIMMRAKVGYRLNLEKPKTFNEKMQWLKLYDRDPVYSQMVDKYEAKKYIAEKVGEEHIVPSYGVWNSFDDIDFKRLPNSFVLKTTHDCGGVIICDNKKTFNYEAAKATLGKRLETNFFWQGREWPYKNVIPRIMAEKFLTTENNNDYFTYSEGSTPGIIDYKIMCFNGKPYCCLVCMGRNSKEGLHENFYDKEWNLMPVKRCNPQYRGKVDKPRNLNEMLRCAEILSSGLRFLRVDFFESAGKLYIGELTFYPGSGFSRFIPIEWDYRFGDLIELK